MNAVDPRENVTATRWTIILVVVRLVILATLVTLVIVAVTNPTSSSWSLPAFGVVLLAYAALRIATSVFLRRNPLRSGWWYHRQSGNVVESGLAPSAQFDGPFASREEAARAPEIARERARAWAAEDAAEAE